MEIPLLVAIKPDEQGTIKQGTIKQAHLERESNLTSKHSLNRFACDDLEMNCESQFVIALDCPAFRR